MRFIVINFSYSHHSKNFYMTLYDLVDTLKYGKFCDKEDRTRRHYGLCTAALVKANLWHSTPAGTIMMFRKIDAR